MRRTKNKSQQLTVSPSPKVFGGRVSDPENLKREVSTRSQHDSWKEIMIYGHDNALPLRIAQAVEESPSASSCIDTVSKFIKGSGFSDEELMKLPIDSSGTTLWDFHCGLADSLALFWGFAVNFKFDRSGKIINTFQMSFESCRFKPPGEHSPHITEIKYNPYYGTPEYNDEFTKAYPVFNLKEAQNQVGGKNRDELAAWPGQVYYYGKTSPLSRFYPKPKYWSAKEAIQADHKLQEFNNEELENGFFQSVLINAIGDPHEWSKNPHTQTEETGTDNIKRKKSTETVGEEFNRQMGETFSGSKKAGTAMVLWSLKSDTAIKIQPFPVGINGDRLVATQDSITKTITIATGVPSILANISEGVSLGSGGSEIQKAVELMQSRTVEWREVLMNFYNNILLPNLQKKPSAKVEIQNYNPVSEPVEIDDKVWEFLNPVEKEAFIKKNMPEIEIIRVAAPTTPAPVIPNPDEPIPVVPAEEVKATDPNQDAIDSLIRSLSRKDLAKFYGYVNDFKKGRANLEQTKVFLRAFKFTDEQIMLFLNDPEGDGV